MRGVRGVWRAMHGHLHGRCCQVARGPQKYSPAVSLLQQLPPLHFACITTLMSLSVTYTTTVLFAAITLPKRIC